MRCRGGFVIVLVCLEPPSPCRASRAALALALARAGSAQVVALVAGGRALTPTLDLARASAARVIHLDDPALDKADFFTTGMVLAEAARHLGAGVILAGQHSDQEGQGLVPAVLAHHLHAPSFARVLGLGWPASSPDTVELTLRAGGRICRIESPLPAVLTTEPGAAVPPARAADAAVAVETLSLAQLGLDPSRVVPRPDLLGTLVDMPAERSSQDR
jgi:electron transfer flavoprotein alpha/beta subunit